MNQPSGLNEDLLETCRACSARVAWCAEACLTCGLPTVNAEHETAAHNRRINILGMLAGVVVVLLIVLGVLAYSGLRDTVFVVTTR